MSSTPKYFIVEAQALPEIYLKVARAKQALYEKRIPRELWEEALADYPDQTEKIESFLRARLGPESDRREIKRAVDALIRRGHSYGSIQRVLRMMQLETEEYLED